jgi:transcriptional regulator with XRE-family HTH domain
MARQHPKADLYMAERAKGKTYREIAEQYGVTRQAIADACGKYEEGKFKPWTEERCIYPNLRKWLNENKVSMKEFIRRAGNIPGGNTDSLFRNYFKGKNEPRKGVIDKMLEVTGLTYEQLWEVDDA